VIERSLLLDLYAAFHKSGQVVDRACAGTGIEPEDFAFVSIVGGREPVTPTAISREFGLSLSTVLFRATRNVELGFVERVGQLLAPDRESVQSFWVVIAGVLIPQPRARHH